MMSPQIQHDLIADKVKVKILIILFQKIQQKDDPKTQNQHILITNKVT